MNYAVGLYRFIRMILMIPFLVVIAACVFPRKGEQEYRRLVQLWSRRLLASMGIGLRLKGPELRYEEPGKTGLLLLCNHTSFLDIFAVDAFLCSRFVAKAEIGRWPFLGSIARGVRTIFIDRKNKRGILGILEQMELALKKGENVIFFPEGTTSPGDRLLPLHSNLFEASVASGADIQPLVLRYTERGEQTTRMAYVGQMSIFRCLWHVVTTRDAAIEVEVLPRFSVDGMNRHQLCRKASRVMSEGLGVADPADGTSLPRETAAGCKAGA